MYLGQVLGTVVATRKAKNIDGLRLMLVQPLTEQRTPKGNVVVAVDAVNAGPGDLVHLVSSREASLACPNTFVPVDAAICGIVDALDVEAP